MNNIWREVIERAADTLDDLGAPLNADELRRLTTAGQQAAGVSDAVAEAVLDEYVRICVDEHAEHAGRGARVDAMRRALTAAGAAPEGCIRVSRVLAETAAIVAAEWLDLFAETPGLEKYERYTYGPQVEVLRDDLKAALAATPNPGAQHGQEGRDHG